MDHRYVLYARATFDVVEDTGFESHFEPFFLWSGTRGRASLKTCLLSFTDIEAKRVGPRTAVFGTGYTVTSQRSRRAKGGRVFQGLAWAG